MSDIYLWCITGISIFLALNTIWRLWTEKHRLGVEDLSDEDRSFAWRIVIFLVFPLMNYLDLKSTMVTCELLGGYTKSWSYGLLWYHIIPAGLQTEYQLTAVYFAGTIVQLLLAVCLLPALAFRPHPFLATIIGYTVSLLFGFNLIVDPLLSLAGLGSPRWQILYSVGSQEERLGLLLVHLLSATIFVGFMMSQRIRLRFAQLARPQASDELKKALSELNSRPESIRLICRVGLLYERAGLRRRADKQLGYLRKTQSGTLYHRFLEGLIAYRRRNYKAARGNFLTSSDFPGVDGVLKANLLAACACCAFAEGDTISALNFSERALEFDDNCLMARMVKVDVFLKQGRKEQAGEEILQAMGRGLNLDLENKVPLDVDRTFESITRLEDRLGTGTFNTRLELPR